MLNKKSHGVPAQADPVKHAVFIEKYMELKNTIRPDEIILFRDSTHPQHQLLSNGNSRDMCFYSILPNEWPNVKANLNCLLVKPR